jgi:hypothetical protein
LKRVENTRISAADFSILAFMSLCMSLQLPKCTFFLFSFNSLTVFIFGLTFACQPAHDALEAAV